VVWFVGVYRADTHVRLDGGISDRVSSKQPTRLLLSSEKGVETLLDNSQECANCASLGDC
jgi:hypothetical protein